MARTRKSAKASVGAATQGHSAPPSPGSPESLDSKHSRFVDLDADLDTSAAATIGTELDPLEFAPLESSKHLYRQQFVATHDLEGDSSEELVPYRVVIQTYLLYLVLIIIGHGRDYLDKWFSPLYRSTLMERDGYAPLLTDFDSFYTRRLKARLQDCFARPTTGVPGRYIHVFKRRFRKNTFFELEDNDAQMAQCLNLASYNYLGFAQSRGQCSVEAVKALEEVGLVSGGSRAAGANSVMLEETEKIVADFVGKESAMIWSMGYGTNAMVFRTLVDKRCLVLSDELNHASLRTGLRISGAVIKVFKHNNMRELEEIIREQIAQGQPRSRRPWRKIMIVFEGLYSMEGTMCNLPALIELRRKYGVYLYMDEAHSIGAMGPHGKGVCDYFGVSPTEVDILMGTFTKSFGSVGGYVAGDHELIDRLRVSCMGNVYGECPAPPTLAQIQASLRTLTGEIRPGEARLRLQRLAFNSRYLRVGLRKMGFIITGHIDSPVISLLLYHPTKIGMASRMLLDRNVAVVVVGYPATPLHSSRIRFCMSAALTKSDLDDILQKMDEVGDFMRLKYVTPPGGQQHYDDFKDTLADEVLDPKLQ